MAKIGYALAWRPQENIDLQINILRLEGCEQIFAERVSGVKFIQIEFEQLLKVAQKGDTIVACGFLNLGKDITQLIQLIEALKLRGVHLKSLKESYDSATPMGDLFYRMMCVLADTEKCLRRENTLEGLRITKEKGRKGGIKWKGLNPQYQLIAAEVKKVHDSMMYSNKTIQEIFSIKNKAIFYQILAFANQK
jgi:DNA invertase Pin-like site-specific DNA recombinase